MLRDVDLAQFPALHVFKGLQHLNKSILVFKVLWIDVDRLDPVFLEFFLVRFFDLNMAIDVFVRFCAGVDCVYLCSLVPFGPWFLEVDLFLTRLSAFRLGFVVRLVDFILDGLVGSFFSLLRETGAIP